MANSLGDQFLKAGLVSKDRLNKAKKSRHKQKKAKHNRDGVTSEAALVARQAAAEKAARDRALNQQQKEAAERRAIQAQVRQLIEMNRLSGEEGEVAYHFQDGKVIKTLYVSREAHDRLGRGLLAIARIDTGYAVIPSVVAEKIRLRDAGCIVSREAARADSGDDDPYADYKVPDDLMW